MMKKWMIALGLFAATVFSVSYAFAQGSGHGPGHGSAHPESVHGRGHGEMRHHESAGAGKDLSMTAEQKAKFQELRRKFRSENAQLIGAMVAKRLELQTLWTDPKAESKAIMDKERELSDLKNQMRDKAVQLKLEARKFLTPEQITKFGSRWGMRHGFGCSHMMGGHGKMDRGGMMGCDGMLEHGRGMGHGMGMMDHGAGHGGGRMGSMGGMGRMCD
jgi:Spy/CpxP family protein refolding chaperone